MQKVGLGPNNRWNSWRRTAFHSAGNIAVAAAGKTLGWVGFRAKPYDPAGDDVMAFSDLNFADFSQTRLHRIPLACVGPVVGSVFRYPVLACKTGPHTVSWHSLRGSGSHDGTIHVPWTFAGQFGLAASDNSSDGYLVTTDTSGVIHEQDLTQDLSWTLGHAAGGTAAISDLTYRELA